MRPHVGRVSITNSYEQNIINIFIRRMTREILSPKEALRIISIIGRMLDCLNMDVTMQWQILRNGSRLAVLVENKPRI